MLRGVNTIVSVPLTSQQLLLALRIVETVLNSDAMLEWLVGQGYDNAALDELRAVLNSQQKTED